MPKDAFYFPHDSNARHDPKILKMRSVYKLEGLGLYWAIIEMMREQENYLLQIDDGSIEGYAIDLNCTPEYLRQFLQDCTTKFNLFNADDNFMWSDSLLRRMSRYDDRSMQARDAALMRWHSERYADALPTQSERTNGKNNSNPDNNSGTNNADALPTQSERNAKRVKENKRDNNKIDINNIILPDFIDRELWNDFMEMRDKKKVPITERAIQLLISRLTLFNSEGQNPNRIIENSIMRGWTGVFPDKSQMGVNNGKTSPNHPNNEDNENNTTNKYINGKYGNLVEH